MCNVMGTITVIDEEETSSTLVEFLLNRYVNEPAQTLIWNMLITPGYVREIDNMLPEMVRELSFEEPNYQFVVTKWNNVTKKIQRTIYHRDLMIREIIRQDFVKESVNN